MLVATASASTNIRKIVDGPSIAVISKRVWYPRNKLQMDSKADMSVGYMILEKMANVVCI